VWLFVHPVAPNRYKCCKEQNLLLTEMALQGIPRDLEQQRLQRKPRGHPHEQHMHRVRYAEVRCGSRGCDKGFNMPAWPVITSGLRALRNAHGRRMHGCGLM
jgi:hypothetical protein